MNGYINPYYWVDDHPLLYGNNGSLDPRTYEQSNSCTAVEYRYKNYRVENIIYSNLYHLPKWGVEHVGELLEQPPSKTMIEDWID